MEWRLDIGSGLEAERWCALPSDAAIRRVAMDPLITSGMVESGRLSPLPDGIERVGAEVRPAGSVETGKVLSFLPFRSQVFSQVHCGFVLHLYLEVLPLLVVEAHRVLLPNGTFTVHVPHFGEARSDAILRDTHAAVRWCFGDAKLDRYSGPALTFWTDLYREKVWEISAVRAGE